MHDQKKLWNTAHQHGELDPYSTLPTAFAHEVLTIIPPTTKILELGCGVGNDSIAFANAGHTIIATDFSELVIHNNKELYKDNTNVIFQVLDMNEPFAFENEKFDVVYARLSLHYFVDNTTQKIFSEIHRVLKPDGFFCFICKSTTDPFYSKGDKIEKDMFEYNGHVRHFFSEEYTKSLLKGNFKIVKIESGNEVFYGNDSAFIKVIAQKDIDKMYI